jgi:hypothetical protein
MNLEVSNLLCRTQHDSFSKLAGMVTALPEPGEHIPTLSLLRKNNAKSPHVDYEKTTGWRVNAGQQKKFVRKNLDAGIF